jgi:predicted HTH transcriptional regulator
MPFNPLIASAFYQARYIEHVGSGIEDVEVACAEAGLPQTTVDVRNRTIVHTIWRKTTKETGKTSKKTTKENEATSKKTSKKTIKKTGQVFLLPDGLSDATRKIAETMLSNPWISARGATEMLGLTQQGVQYHLVRLSSVLHHEGGDKGGRWVFGPKPKGKRGAK